MKITKNLSIFITVFVLVFGIQFIQPKKANAFLGIGDISFDIPTLIKEFGIDTLVTILQNRVLNKLIDDTLNWANGGFDGEPGFINNWDGFLEGTKHDVLSNAFYSATNVASDAAEQYGGGGAAHEECLSAASNLVGTTYDNCIDQCTDGECTDDQETICNDNAFQAEENAIATCNNNQNLYGNLSGIAEQNYDAYMNGNLVTTRSVAMTIANYGAKELNMDPVTDLINGQGNTLTYLLGSQSAVDTFGQDITKGGWNAYMALSDPHNYPSGLSSLVSGALGSKTEKTVATAVQSKQTPQKYEDKRKCVEWGDPVKDKKDLDGNTISTVGAGSRVCLRYETQTPGNLIESKVKKSLTKDEDQSYLARELSDVLAKALGRLTDGLLQAGMNAIAKKMSGGHETKTLEEKINETFSNSYQNAYDVLGIADDAALFNSAASDAAGSTGGQTLEDMMNGYMSSDGDDASVPYVGGPEDLVGLEWNEGPELIVELKGNLDKSYMLTEELLLTNIKIRREMNESSKYVGNLDHCRPGPDYGWEDRYNDKAQQALSKVEHLDEDECAEMQSGMQTKFFDVGLPTIKRMNSDSFINIPGSAHMTSVINSLLGDSNKQLMQRNTDEISAKKNMLAMLTFMKEETRNAPKYVAARDLIDSRIPMFTDDLYREKEEGGHVVRINKLTDQDLIEILSIEVGSSVDNKINGQCKSYLNEYLSQPATNTVTGCTYGVYENIDNSELVWKWNCNGIGAGATNTTCSATKNIYVPNPHPYDEEDIYIDEDDSGDDSESEVPEIETTVSLWNIKNLFATKNAFAAKLETTATAKQNLKNYLIESQGLYLFREGETPEILVANNRKKAEEIAIGLGWKIWRDISDNEHRKLKSKLRYQYHMMEGDITTEKDVLETKIKLQDMTKMAETIANYSSDCYVFINTVKDKSDDQIRILLSSEYEKQENREESIFDTQLFTSPANVKTSILKFENQSEIDDYFETMYPPFEDTDYPVIARSVKKILAQDRTVRTVTQNNEGTGETTTSLTAAAFIVPFGIGGLQQSFVPNPNSGKRLFCATPSYSYAKYSNFWGKHGCMDGHSMRLCVTTGTTKGQTWYYGRSIDYTSALAGI